MLLTKTEVGGKYNVHHDMHDLGDYSTTVFLSDPSTYDGGELRIDDGNEIKEFKPPAGYAVTYKTGYHHQVAPVISGTRVVLVFWTVSQFRDHRLNSLYGDLLNLQGIVEHKKCSTIEEAKESPSFMLGATLESLKRNFRDN